MLNLNISYELCTSMLNKTSWDPFGIWRVEQSTKAYFLMEEETSLNLGINLSASLLFATT